MSILDSRVTIIMPTTCTARRRRSLLRAVESVLSQTGASIEGLVVVNGPRVDPDVLAELNGIAGARVVRQDTASLPLAMRHGRSLVTTPFFGFLDDDDEYLPGAIATRLRPLIENPSLDCVATNGYRCVDEVSEPAVMNAAAVLADPLRALLSENWLASCGALYRSASITLEYFDAGVRFLEWTYLAYRLALSRTVAFLDVPTFRIHETEDSLSKSDAYHEAQIEVLSTILTLDLPSDVKQGLLVNLGKAYHDLSNHFRLRGDVRRAWNCHLRSLRCPRGAQYLSYSRKLLPFWPRA